MKNEDSSKLNESIYSITGPSPTPEEDQDIIHNFTFGPF